MDKKKVREAIDFIKTLITAGNGDERLYTTIEALEKQVPKKPTDSGLRSGIFKITKCYSCPRCGNACLRRKANERQDNNYCWDCGQAIDWSKEEDHETD